MTNAVEQQQDQVERAATPCTLEQIVTRAGTPDVFVLRRVQPERFMHIGGAGRGTGWAGIVDLLVVDEPHIAAALKSQQPLPVGDGSRPTHVFGPYYAAAAVVVPVNHDVVVVLGNPSAPIEPEAMASVLDCALQAESLVAEVSPAKRLADELELLGAVRAVMQVPSPRLAEVARHVVRTAAESLSCEVAVLYLVEDDRVVVHADPARGLDRDRLLPLMRTLAAAAADLPTCEQRATERPLPAPLSPADGVMSHYALRLGDDRDARGVLVVCHLAEAARGFTSLCQELGRRLADAADTVLHAAQLRDALERQVDAVQREAACDPLTGMANRRAFDVAVAAAEQRRADGDDVGVIVLDLDGLKAANDTRGHDVGDRLLQRTAEVLSAAVGGDGIAARLGGDEFAVLVHRARAVDVVAERIRRGVAESGPIDGLRLSVAIGTSTTSPSEDVQRAIRHADRAMYAAKLADGRGRPAALAGA